MMGAQKVKLTHYRIDRSVLIAKFSPKSQAPYLSPQKNIKKQTGPFNSASNAENGGKRRK